MNGNSHISHDCPYCWRVLYSKGALTRHINADHWEELESDEQTDYNGFPYCEVAFGQFMCGSPVKKWGEYCQRHSSV